MTAYPPRTAWELIGWDDGLVRISGGRATYEAVVFNDSGRAYRPSLQRLVARGDRLLVQKRYVDPDTLLVPADDTARANWRQA